MPHLRTENKMDRRITRDFIAVDMGKWISSRGYPLYTVGAATCLNVVVHRVDNYTGALAHIHMGESEEDLDQGKLYDKACRIIVSMMNDLGGTDKEYSLWLGAGSAFHPGKLKINPIEQSFPGYLRQKITLHPRTEIYDFRKDMNSGDIVYSPHNCKVYILGGQDDIEFVRSCPSNEALEKQRQESESLWPFNRPRPPEEHIKKLLDNYFK